MNQTIITRLLVLGVLVLAARGTIALGDNITITENEATETISATINGNPFPVTVTGAPDNWTVQLPATFYVDPDHVEQGDSILLADPTNPTLMSTVTFTQLGSGSFTPATLIFQGGIPITMNNLPTIFTIPGGVYQHDGVVATFDLTVQVVAGNNGVPDAASTGSLLLVTSGALFGASLLRQRRTHVSS